MTFVIIGRSPPNCLKTPTNTGTMKVTRPIRTIIANVRTTIGYIIADLTWRRSESSCSSWSATRSSELSSMPPVSPARTIATKSGEKTSLWRSIESDSGRPASTSLRIAVSTSHSFLFSVCASST